MPQPLLTEAGLVMEVMEEVMVVGGRTVAAGTLKQKNQDTVTVKLFITTILTN